MIGVDKIFALARAAGPATSCSIIPRAPPPPPTPPPSSSPPSPDTALSLRVSAPSSPARSTFSRARENRSNFRRISAPAHVSRRTYQLWFAMPRDELGSAWISRERISVRRVWKIRATRPPSSLLPESDEEAFLSKKTTVSPTERDDVSLSKNLSRN